MSGNYLGSCQAVIKLLWICHILRSRLDWKPFKSFFGKNLSFVWKLCEEKKCVSCTRWYNTSPLYPHQQCENFMIFISNWKNNSNFMFYFIKVFELNIKPNYSGKRNRKHGSLPSIQGPKRSRLFVDLTMVTVKWCYLIFFQQR